jgi:hypothetical protein
MSKSRRVLENKTQESIIKRYDAKTSDEEIELLMKRIRKAVETQKLSALDKALASTVVLRQKLANFISYKELVELINAKTVFETASNSSKCLHRKELFDFRNALYSMTVSLYDAKSKFANSLTLFDIECSVSVKLHASSSKQLHRIEKIRFNSVVTQALTAKKNVKLVREFTKLAIAK